MLVHGAQTGAHRVDRQVGRAGARPRVDLGGDRVRVALPAARGPPSRSPPDPGRRRAPRASTTARASSSAGPGGIIGNQPSASRPARRSRAATPPRSTAGWVAAPAAARDRRPSPGGSAPSNVTDRSVHSRRSNSSCSSERLPRLPNSSPRASYSTAFQPSPTPSRSRPPLSRSTSAACLATSAVCRCGRMITPVTSSSVVVTRRQVAEHHQRLVERRVACRRARSSPDAPPGRRRRTWS